MTDKVHSWYKNPSNIPFIRLGYTILSILHRKSIAINSCRIRAITVSLIQILCRAETLAGLFFLSERPSRDLETSEMKELFKLLLEDFFKRSHSLLYEELG